MPTPRVLMMGYYGRANFGDDVLMLTTYRILKQAMPRATISMIIDPSRGHYVRAMLSDIEILTSGRHEHFDLIVHGGGGVFFDFKTYSVAHRLVGAALNILGYRAYVQFEKHARHLLGKPLASATHRLGFGIGVGTFSSGSVRLRQKLHILADFDALWVRDAASIDNLEPFSCVLTGEVIHGSDLAFLHEYWEAEPRVRNDSSRIRLGIALRDWSGHVAPETLSSLLSTLSSEFDITGFVLDRECDPHMQRILAPYPSYVWNPDSMSIADFASQLAAQDVLLTSRAHGAICGACLGVPSVIIPIEPKLNEVHAMLPKASVLGDLRAVEPLKQAIYDASMITAEAIADDVARNRAASDMALNRISRWLK